MAWRSLSLQSFVALFVFLLVPHHIAGATISEADVLKFTQRMPVAKPFQSFYGRRLQVGVARSVARANRAMLQSPAAPFCSFDNDTCSANIIENIPDEDTQNYFLVVQTCSAITDRTSCQEQLCVWFEGECSEDPILLAQDCFTPAFTLFIGSGQCDQMVTEMRCSRNPGCKWSPAGVCEISEDELLEAFSNDEALANAIGETIECSEKPTCSEECVFLEGSCLSSSLADITPWITGTTILCNAVRQGAKCQGNPPDACPDDCNVSEAGTCDLAIASDIFVEIAFVDNTALGDQMKAALEQCPSITSSDDCVAFSP